MVFARSTKFARPKVGGDAKFEADFRSFWCSRQISVLRIRRYPRKLRNRRQPRKPGNRWWAADTYTVFTEFRSCELGCNRGNWQNFSKISRISRFSPIFGLANSAKSVETAKSVTEAPNFHGFRGFHRISRSGFRRIWRIRRKA